MAGREAAGGGEAALAGGPDCTNLSMIAVGWPRMTTLASAGKIWRTEFSVGTGWSSSRKSRPSASLAETLRVMRRDGLDRMGT